MFLRNSKRRISTNLKSILNGYQPLTNNKESTAKFISKEPYFLSQSNLRQLKLIITTQINNKIGDKNLVVSSAHPGGNRILEGSIRACAAEIESDLLLIDYQSIIQAVKEIKLNKSMVPRHQWNLNRIIEYSKSFNPGAYRIYEHDDVEEDEEDDDDEDLDIGPAIKGGPLFIKKQHESLEIQKVSDSEFKEFPRKRYHTTPFDIALSDNDISSYLDNLHDSIATKYKKGKLVIYLNDLTDIIEGSNMDTGKKLFSGLTDLVATLRKAGCQILLVVSSSPSIVDAKNISPDIEFYSQILDGAYFAYGPDGIGGNLAMDGTLFGTVLDNIPDEFQKIEILPPSYVYLSLQKSLNPIKKPNILKRESKALQNQLRIHLIQMENDLKIHIGEINKKSIFTVCKDYGIEIDEPLLRLMQRGIKLVLGRKMNQDLEDVFSLLTARIWTMEKIKELVLLAVGCRTDSLNSDTLCNEINAESLVEALGIMYETDISRFAAMTQSEIDKRLAAIPLESETYTPNITKGRDHPIEGPSRVGPDAILADIKRRGMKLNTHEKRLLTTIVNPDDINVKLSDLILPPDTKLALQTLVTLPILKPEFFSSGLLSKSALHGVLLFGPPGTGKTMLAKALANSSGACFMNISLADIYDKYVGEGEKNMKAVFTLARKLDRPCVIFLDEVDALFGSRRGDGNGSTRREVMNVCMAEWDGLGSKNNGILVLGATNRPFDLDDAVLRRMPRRVLIDLPDENARKKILQANLKDEVINQSVDLRELAKKTLMYSGSDLKNVCVSAALARLKESIVRGISNNSDSKLEIDQIENWIDILKGNESLKKPSELEPLKPIHFEIGLRECPPSLAEETETLVELRKWDSVYGDGASKRGKRMGYGFLHKT